MKKYFPILTSSRLLADVSTLKSDASSTIAGVEQFTGLSVEHVDTPVNYPQTPHENAVHSLDSADDPRLLQFIAQYENDPNAPEPGAVC